MLDVKTAVDRFKKLKEPIRVISHLDSDGITAAAIFSKLMQLEDKSFVLTIVKQLNEQIIRELSYEEYNSIVFTDLGSGQIGMIENYLGDKDIIILDHHKPQKETTKPNITQVNPHLQGIDGGTQIAGAGVTFLFAREINKEIDNYAHLAIIGAMGDVQEKGGFTGPNKDILQIAIKKKKLIIEQMPRIYGAYGRNLSKIIEYGNFKINNVTSNQDASIKFVENLGLNPRAKLYELTEENKEKFYNAIQDNTEKDIMGPVYILPNERVDSAFRDIREFSTLLNACGRLDKPEVGIGACLGNEEDKMEAQHTLRKYKQELMDAITWFNDNKDKDPNITNTKKYAIINAKDRVIPTIAGTIASILSRKPTNEYEIIVSMSRTDSDKTKVSTRRGKNCKMDLRNMVKDALHNIKNAEFGGHMNAVGILIPSDQEEQLILNFKNILDKL